MDQRMAAKRRSISATMRARSSRAFRRADLAEADKGVHLVRVPADGLGHGAEPDDVGVGCDADQRRLAVRQPPQHPVQQGEALGVAVSGAELGQFHEGARDGGHRGGSGGVGAAIAVLGHIAGLVRKRRGRRDGAGAVAEIVASGRIARGVGRRRSRRGAEVVARIAASGHINGRGRWRRGRPGGASAAKIVASGRITGSERPRRRRSGAAVAVRIAAFGQIRGRAPQRHGGRETGVAAAIFDLG